MWDVNKMQELICGVDLSSLGGKCLDGTGQDINTLAVVPGSSSPCMFLQAVVGTSEGRCVLVDIIFRQPHPDICEQLVTCYSLANNHQARPSAGFCMIYDFVEVLLLEDLHGIINFLVSSLSVCDSRKRAESKSCVLA